MTKGIRPAYLDGEGAVMLDVRRARLLRILSSRASTVGTGKSYRLRRMAEVFARAGTAKTGYHDLVTGPTAPVRAAELDGGDRRRIKAGNELHSITRISRLLGVSDTVRAAVAGFALLSRSPTSRVG